jgi:hypothetical protein
VHRRQQRVPVQQLQVPGELFHRVDPRVPLHLDGDVHTGVVAAHDVDRADRRRVLAPDQPPALAEQVELLGEQFLQVRLDAVLDKARIDAEVDRGVGQRLLDGDGQGLAALVGHRPLARLPVATRVLRQAAGRRHPVERLVGAAVGMDEHRPVGLHDEQPQGGREMGGEPAVVVDAAPRDDESHTRTLLRTSRCYSRVDSSDALSSAVALAGQGHRAGSTGAKTRQFSPG